MKMFCKQIISPLCFCITIIISLIAVIYIFCIFDTNCVPLNNNHVTELNDGWYYLNGTQKVYIKTLPRSIDVNEKSVISITNTIPEDLSNDSVMCVKTKYQAIQAFIGDELVYDFGTENELGLKYGSVLNLINISESQKGQNITLNILSSSSLWGKSLSKIVLGDKGSILIYILRENIGSILFSVLVFTLGLIFILFSIYLTIRPVRLNRNSYLFFGIFLILSAIWTISDTNVFQFFNISIKARYLMSVFSFLLFPIPLLLYIKGICSRGRKIFNILSSLFAVWLVVNLICYVFNIVQLTDILFISHILLVLSIISVLYFSALDKFKYHSNNMNIIFIGTSIFSISSFINLLQRYFSLVKDSSHVFRIGMVVFILILCFDIFKKSLGLLNTNMEVSIYKQLAYTDVATGLRNRAAYDISIKELNYHWGKSSVCIIIFDVDNLKINNDTLGHLVGDELIRGVAQCIKETFIINDSYRIGGDEFAVLIKEDKEEVINSLLQTFNNCVDKYNSSHEHVLSVSWGRAIAVKSNLKFNDVYDLFNSADMDMYSNKVRKNKKTSLVTPCAESTEVDSRPK